MTGSVHDGKFHDLVSKVKLLTVLASQVGLERIQEEYPEIEVRLSFRLGVQTEFTGDVARSGWQPLMKCSRQVVSYLQVSVMPCVLVSYAREYNERNI
jgi:hypothetical protein